MGHSPEAAQAAGGLTLREDYRSAVLDDEGLLNLSEPPAKRPDFRTISAENKRVRMRARLVEAVLKVSSDHGGNAVIEDVLKEAKVSRGTFYSYFESFHHALSWAGQRVANEYIETLLQLYSDVEDPVTRAALGSQSVLARAALDPSWCELTARIDELEWGGQFLSGIRTTTEHGQRLGVFHVTDLEAAIDINVGTLIQGAKTLRHRKTKRWDYIVSQCRQLLMALGVEEARAQAAALSAKETLDKHAPAAFDWWREFD